MLYFVMRSQGVDDYSFVYSLDKQVCTNTGAPYSASLGILGHFTKTGALMSV